MLIIYALSCQWIEYIITSSMADEFECVVTAPVNIALIKYWGKRDTELILPYNDSLSLSLDEEKLG